MARGSSRDRNPGQIIDGKEFKLRLWHLCTPCRASEFPFGREHSWRANSLLSEFAQNARWRYCDSTEARSFHPGQRIGGSKTNDLEKNADPRRPSLRP